jgi:hypothetical protein
MERGFGTAFAAGGKKLQVPRLPPDFLSDLVASANFVRLSLKKAAYVAVDESSIVGNPEFARDDKGRVGASMGIWLVDERVRGKEQWYPTSREKRARCGAPVLC